MEQDYKIAMATDKALISSKSKALRGVVPVPGDKSISHRALLLASQAIGRSTISGLLEGEDVLDTAKALRQMGVTITQEKDTWVVDGVGTGGLAEPDDVLNMGNSGTGSRLMMGLVATHPFTTFFTGDKSLRSRPMDRVTKPLSAMGARFISRSGGRLPLAVIGAAEPLPLEYTLPVASAQVKTAILLAGLNTPGKTTVIEPEATRDHTERMLAYFGAEVLVKDHSPKGKSITVTGHSDLTAKTFAVPGDPSSAAFLAVAALVVPGSEITIKDVCINPSRTGLYKTLQEMGGDIRFENQRQVGGEPVADIRVRASALKGVRVPAERAPSMIDEYPVLAVAASCADGVTVMEGLAELKVKESNRLLAIADGLAANGALAKVGTDSLEVTGNGLPPQGGGTVRTFMDHRIAMAFLVLGFVTDTPVKIDSGAMIQTSFPTFVSLMNGIGATISGVDGQR